MYLLIVFLILIIGKFSLNFFRLVATAIMFKIFRKHPKNIAQFCVFVTFLFDSANTQKIVMYKSRINGINQMHRDYISNCLGSADANDELSIVFQKTMGVYIFRMLQAINPFYWLFLPKYILLHFNINAPKIIQYPLQLMYWCVSFGAAYILEKYLDSHFQDFFQQIIDMLP